MVICLEILLVFLFMSYILLGTLESPFSFFLVYPYDSTYYKILLQCEIKYFLNVTFFFLMSYNTENF